MLSVGAFSPYRLKKQAIFLLNKQNIEKTAILKHLLIFIFQVELLIAIIYTYTYMGVIMSLKPFYILCMAFLVASIHAGGSISTTKTQPITQQPANELVPAVVTHPTTPIKTVTCHPFEIHYFNMTADKAMIIAHIKKLEQHTIHQAKPSTATE